jgi:indolepyruvate ferredoxin oxidoreductase beta subunit
MNQIYNILICGVGGQGVITLTQLIAEAARLAGYDVKTSELHGLSQKGGSVQTFIRFGKMVYSPLFSSGRADLIMGLEANEVLREINFAKKEAVLVANEYFLPYDNAKSKEEVLGEINKLYAGEKHILSASKICERELGKEVLSGVYLLGFVANHNIIPIQKEFFELAIANLMPEKYLDINQKAFELSSKITK